MADLQNILYQIVLSILRDSKFTSASEGHVNRFDGIMGGQTAIGSDEEIRKAIEEIVRAILEEGGFIPEEEEDENIKAIKEKDFLTEKTALKGAQKVKGLAQNPTSIVQMGLAALPHAALVAFAISLTPLVFDYLTRPGGPMDVRWKRVLENEFNAFLSRQTQKDTQMGVRQVVIQSKIGFTAANGVNNYNTSRGIREGGINPERESRIKMADHTKGLW